jgi:hypothetical protein
MTHTHLLNEDIWKMINEYRIDRCKIYVKQKNKNNNNYTNLVHQLNRIIYQHDHYCKHNEMLHRIQTYPYLPIIFQSQVSLLLSTHYREFCFSFNVFNSMLLVRRPMLNLDFNSNLNID